jgi:hypothetical protein
VGRAHPDFYLYFFDYTGGGGDGGGGGIDFGALATNLSGLFKVPCFLCQVHTLGNHRNYKKCSKHIIPILLQDEVFTAWTFKNERLDISLNPQSHPPIKFFQQTALPTGSMCMQQQFKTN